MPACSGTCRLSNWTHTHRSLLAQPMFGCVNAGDQVAYRSHLEKQDTRHIGAASTESDPCVRKTGCCLWTGGLQDLCFRMLQHNFLPCVAFVHCLRKENKGLLLQHSSV